MSVFTCCKPPRPPRNAADIPAGNRSRAAIVPMRRCPACPDGNLIASDTCRTLPDKVDRIDSEPFLAAASGHFSRITR